jgi:uncharacterized membrane protein YdbT with pleckstrin-like domain
MWDIDSKHLQKDEKIEFQDVPSIMSCIFSCLWIAFMLLITILSFVIGNAEIRFNIIIFGVFTLPAIYIVLTRLSTKYAISNRNLLTRTGILTTSLKSVPFKFVTSTEVKENILGKIFNYANVNIDTAGSGKSVEVNWMYLKSAHKVKKLIESKITVEV